MMYSDGYHFGSESDSNDLLQMITQEDKQEKKKIPLIEMLPATIPLAHDELSSPFFNDRLKWPQSMLPC